MTDIDESEVEKTLPNGKVPEQLETKEEKQTRMLSLNIIYFTMFLMTLGFSIILTGVWPFLDKLDPNAGKQFLGLIIAANPLAQMIFSPVFGYWVNKVSSIRSSFICSLLIFCVASAIYSSLEVVDYNVKYWMLGARFLVGASSANIVICRSYVAAATTIAERTKATSILTLAQTLGFIFGPLIQGLFTPLSSKSIVFKKIIVINMYTAPGWSNVFLGLFNIFLFMPFMFKDKRIAARENMILQGKETEKEAWKSVKPDYHACWALIFSLFLFVFNFVLLESLGTPLTMENFAWSNEEALRYMAYIMGVGGVVATLMFFFISPLSKKFKESHLLIYGGFLLMILGRIAHIPYGNSKLKLAIPREFQYSNGTVGYYDENDERVLGCPTSVDWCHNTPALGIYEFLIGYLLTSIGYPIGLTLIQSIFSKVIGARPQGLWQSLITGAGCFSRILGPLFVSFVYSNYGTFWLSVSTGLMMIFPIFWLISIRNRLDVKPVQLPIIKEFELMNVDSSNTKN